MYTSKRANVLHLSLLLCIFSVHGSYLSRGLSQTRQTLNNHKDRIFVPARNMVTGAEPALVVAAMGAAPAVATAGVGAAVITAATLPLSAAAEAIAPGAVPGAAKCLGFWGSVANGISNGMEKLFYGKTTDQINLEFMMAYEAKEIARQQAQRLAKLAAEEALKAASKSAAEHAARLAMGTGGGVVIAKAAPVIKVAAGKITLALAGKSAAAVGTKLTLAKGSMILSSTTVIKLGAGTAAASAGTGSATAATATAPGWVPWIYAAAVANPVVAVPVVAGTVVGGGYLAWAKVIHPFLYPTTAVTTQVATDIGMKLAESAISSSELEAITSLRSSSGGGNRGGSSGSGGGGPKKPWDGSTVHTGSPMPDPDKDRIQRSDVDLYKSLKDIKKSYEYDKSTDSYKLKDRHQPIEPDVEALKIDEQHWEFEAYNGRGKHLGAIDPVTKKFYKPSVIGRQIKKSK